MLTSDERAAMGPQDRYDWIEDQLRTGGWYAVDVLDRAFVDCYADATHASIRPTNYGADKCPQLGRDLSAMARDGRLCRIRVGISGMYGMGFPTWAWSYYLPNGQSDVDL